MQTQACAFVAPPPRLSARPTIHVVAPDHACPHSLAPCPHAAVNGLYVCPVQQLYVTPTSSSPAHLKKFAFVGLFMAKALIETAARGKELGSVMLNLCFSEPFWKLLLGQPLSLMDLQQLDPTEFRSEGCGRAGLQQPDPGWPVCLLAGTT